MDSIKPYREIRNPNEDNFIVESGPAAKVLQQSIITNSTISHNNSTITNKAAAEMTFHPTLAEIWNSKNSVEKQVDHAP